MAEQLFDFGALRRARFVERPNRFLVRAKLRNGRVVKAFLPNPGRLWELLLPRATLYVAKDAGPGSATGRKTSHTVVAVEREGEPVFLHTHRTNAVARHLIEAGRIPGLEGARVVRSEVPVGGSRLDLLLEHGGEPVYTEVKSVTLFGNGVAMFPDAVTERGRKHLLELAQLSQRSVRTLVLFIAHTRRARWFMPDYHTDLAFSRALLAARGAVGILPVSVGWTQELELRRDLNLLDIPWDFLEREVADRGSYLLLLHLPRRCRIEVGCLGRLPFPKGWYVYVGSAMQGLTKRIERHMRRRKRVHWHIDYLRQAADRVVPLPIRSSVRQECQVADALAALLNPGPSGFGCSDCACRTHFFHSEANPLHSSAFHRVLQLLRIRAPD